MDGDGGVVPNLGRGGAGSLFGRDVARRWLQRHGLSLLVRSRFATWSLTVVLVVVVASSAALAVVRDEHGVAVLVGLAVALLGGLVTRRLPWISGRSGALR